MNISRSSSGFIPASFSLLASSISMSEQKYSLCQHLNASSYTYPRKLTLTILKSDPLTATCKFKSFPYSHFCNMPILLAYISRCPLRNKFVQVMSIVSDSAWHLQKGSKYQWQVANDEQREIGSKSLQYVQQSNWLWWLKLAQNAQT